MLRYGTVRLLYVIPHEYLYISLQGVVIIVVGGGVLKTPMKVCLRSVVHGLF